MYTNTYNYWVSEYFHQNFKIKINICMFSMNKTIVTKVSCADVVRGISSGQIVGSH